MGPQLHGATDDPAKVRAVLDQPGRSTVIVAEVGERLVGAVIAGFDGWRGNLYRLAVLPEYRRRGIALGLVRAAEAWLAGLGAARVSALAIEEQVGAADFWRAAGYSPDDRVRRFVVNL